MHRLELAKRVIKTLRIGSCFLALALASMALPAWSQAACAASVLPDVEVGKAGFFLSDLLGPGTCPQLLTAAAQVRLGAAPLAGSVRVLEGSEVRALLERVPGALNAATAIEVPERIRVRRAGKRASCAEIEDSMFPNPGSLPPDGVRLNPTNDGNAARREIECGAAQRILRGTRVEMTRSYWDPALASWEIRARCQRPEDCVPFLIRVASPALTTTIFPGRPLAEQNVSPGKAIEPRTDDASRNQSSQTLIRCGQTAILLWDAQGIRVVVPSVSLDAGNEGDMVRARIARSGRVVRAIVTGAGRLRAAS